MAVLFPCHQCEGHGHKANLSGQPQDCPRCNGRGWLESTEMSAEEHRHRWDKRTDVSHVPGGQE